MLRWHPAGGQERLRSLVAERVRAGLDPEALAAVPRGERRMRVRDEATRVLREHRVVLAARDLTRIVNQVSDEVVGLGPIEGLLKDPE
ncbi:MAG: hypothetical protein ACRDJP_12465, partial [Actinomycetota bacterium]